MAHFIGVLSDFGHVFILLCPSVSVYLKSESHLCLLLVELSTCSGYSSHTNGEPAHHLSRLEYIGFLYFEELVVL